jgi:phage terminase large subunit GpA-like protein
VTAVAVAPAPNADGRERLTALWAEERALAFAPPPLLTVSQWADQCRVVPSYSAEPGRWVTEKTPYLREIMDCFSDHAINRVVFMKCRRIGATEAGINVIGYFIAQDPSPIFIVQPTVDDAKDFSKEQLTPTIEETDALRSRVSEAASRDSGNTLLAKLFPGGALYLVGANSPRGFRRRTARVVVLEEVDGYPPSAGTEGDQVKLAEGRSDTFQHRRKAYLNSTPTLKGYSRIEREYEASDQRRYFVPCPDCGHRQTLTWSHIKWDDGAPATAAYACEGCGVLISEREKFGMVAKGQWVATNPGHKTAGFHISALYSPWISWGELAEEWLAAQQNPLLLQVFVNQSLGESWEDRRGGLDPETMWTSRRESYTAAPLAAGAVTCGGDIQHDRGEFIVRAWGAGEESWLLERVIVFGDPTTDQFWADVDAVLARTYEHESGARMRILATAIDAGDNYERVLRYCAPRFGRGVFAIKGGSLPAAPFIPKRATRNNKHRCPLFVLGVNQGKALMFGRLKIVGTSTEASAAYKYHFNLSADRDYFEQLTAEKAERKQVNRIWTVVYTCPEHRRNEVSDCELYALAALSLGNLRDSLTKRAKALQERAAAPPSQDPAPEPQSEALTEQDVPRPQEQQQPRWVPRRRRGGGGFSKGWR